MPLLAISTSWPFRLKGYCRCQHLSVHPSVREIRHTITRHRFEPESPNLHQISIMGYYRLVLKIWVINLDLQCHFDSKFSEIWLVCAITCDGIELKSPNLHLIWILRFSWLVLDTGVIDHDLQGHFAIWFQDSKKRRSTSLFHTDLGRPRGVARPNELLYSFILLMNKAENTDQKEERLWADSGMPTGTPNKLDGPRFYNVAHSCSRGWGWGAPSKISRA